MTWILRGTLLGVLWVGTFAAFAQEIKSPAKDVLALAKQAQDGKDVSMSLKALAGKFGGVRAAMNVFNPRSRGGIGYGPKGFAIERRLTELSEKALDADQLKKEADELTLTAHVAILMSEVYARYAPKKEFLGRGKKEWDHDLSEVKAGSKELIEALKAKDAKAVQAAATRINNSCNRCHDGTK